MTSSLSSPLSSPPLPPPPSTLPSHPPYRFKYTLRAEVVFSDRPASQLLIIHVIFAQKNAVDDPHESGFRSASSDELSCNSIAGGILGSGVCERGRGGVSQTVGLKAVQSVFESLKLETVIPIIHS